MHLFSRLCSQKAYVGGDIFSYRIDKKIILCYLVFSSFFSTQVELPTVHRNEWSVSKTYALMRRSFSFGIIDVPVMPSHDGSMNYIIEYCDKEMENKAVKKKWDTLVFVVL